MVDKYKKVGEFISLSKESDVVEKTYRNSRLSWSMCCEWRRMDDNWGEEVSRTIEGRKYLEQLRNKLDVV